jgi:hemolysin III
MVRINKEPVSAYTHFAGFVAALVGLVPLLRLCDGDTAKIVGMALFGGTAALLFLSSSVYHFLDLGERGNRWLRRADHGAIFLLIAGTYISPLIHTLDGAWRISMIAVVGGLALAGMVFKLAWLGCPRWLSAGLYLALGWVIVVPGHLVLPRLPLAGLVWVALGGLAYTIGAVIYARKRPDPLPGTFGFHEVWHLFVLAGAASHYVFMLTLVGLPYPPFGG